MKKLLRSQLIRYILTGGLTTGVNYAVYILMQLCTVHYLVGNSAAWLCAVVFAYFANRRMVFQSSGEKGREFFQFFSLRLATLLVENLLLYLLIDLAGVGALISKVAVSAITVILNYFACKYSIFKGRRVSHE